MLSGICPRGSSRAPGNGKTGITSARSPGFVYSAFIGIVALHPTRAAFTCVTCTPASSRRGRKPAVSKMQPRKRRLREQHRRQPFAPVDGCLVGRTPGLEELDQLLARAVVVPLAVALDDLDEVVDR